MKRDIISFKLSSEEPVENLTFQIGEGMDYQNIRNIERLLIKKALIVAKTFQNYPEDSHSGKMYQSILEEIKEEEAALDVKIYQ
jgi:hypothetical protein